MELILDQPGRPRDKWDGKLIKALYLNEAFEVEGHPVWVEESPNVVFEAKRKKIRSLAAVEAAQETHGKKKNPDKGIRFYADARLKPGATWPTRQEWLDRRRAGEGAVETGESAERVAEAEERARVKVAQNPEVARIVAEAEAKLKARAASADRLE